MGFSKIVVAGGGIIGNSIAYYLSKRNIGVTIIDPVGVAPAASGKAGGFLAKDWSDGSPLSSLQRRSFDLHAELGKEFASQTDYRRLTCEAIAVRGGLSSKPGGKKLEAIEWADSDGVLGHRTMGDESTIAQVHPKKLCQVMFDYAKDNAGASLKVGRVVRAVLEKDESGTSAVKGVELETGEIIEADAFVVACGPWTDEARSWFQKSDESEKSDSSVPHMFGTKYHSILIKAPRVLSQAVFFQGCGDPEVYPRPDGDAYITGFPDPPTKVQDRPGDETIHDPTVQRLKDSIREVSTELGERDPHTVQCCYLPSTTDGLPVIGPLPGVSGAYVASGHTCWGILNGPATGEAMAELLVDGETSHVDLSPFALRRFSR